MTNDISDEKLCAFIDGELASDELDELLLRLQSDFALRDRVAALRLTKDMVRMAYAEVPTAGRGTEQLDVARRMTYRSLAAAMLLGVGLAGGWALRGQALNDPAPAPLLSFLPENVHPVRLASHADDRKVLLHIDSSDPARVRNVLEYADAFLAAAQRTGVTVRLEVVANVQGIDLLRAGVTPYSGRFEALARRDASVELVACGTTIARLQSRGEKPNLVPGVRVAPSALSEIVNRLEEGWLYIKV